MSGAYRVETLEGRTLLSFVTAPNHPVGYGAQAVAMADFNGDGELDVATANGYVETVSVLLGNGDGSFQPRKDSAGIFNSYALVAGDFDEDGTLDLALTYDGTISVVVGNGDGTFQAPVAFDAGYGSTSLATGDFNGDGHLDLVANDPGGDAGSGTVNVLLGNGDGTFQPSSGYAAGPLPVAVAVADLDGDGASDLAVLNFGSGPSGLASTVNVLLGDGDGSFGPGTEFAAGAGSAGPLALAVGEFNGDGAPDLAVANASEEAPTVSVLLGNGDGTLRAPVAYAVGVGVWSVAVGDWDGDGDNDLFTANPGSTSVSVSSNSVSVLSGRGDGTFEPAATFIVGAEPRAVAAGDVDGDGDGDLAVASYDFNVAGSRPSHVALLVSRGDGTFVAPQSYDVGAHPDDAAAGDFNGDGSRDLAVANYHSGYVSVMLGNGDGSFQSPRQFAVGTSAGAVTVGDFNGDGRQDLAVGGDRLDVLLGRGDGTFAPTTFYLIDPAHHGSVAAADFNGDGALDLALSIYALNSVAVLLGNGDGTFRPAVRYGTDREPGEVATGDFNGDGALDLVTPNYYYGTVSVLLGNGDGTFRLRRDFDTGVGSARVAAADFDGDGDLDLAVGNRFASDDSPGGIVSVFLGNGDASFRPAAQYPLASSFFIWDIEVADFNRDGTRDLAVADTTSDTVRVLLGRGDGAFLAPLTCPAGAEPRGLAVGDFNGDSFPDLAAANWTPNTATVLLNDGNWPAAVPAVQHVYVAGSAWSDSFKQFIADRGLGSSQYGFAVADGGQLNTLPWVNVDEVVVRYDAPFPAGGAPVAAVFAVSGVRSGYTVSTVTHLDPQTFMLRLDRALGVQPTSAGGGADGDRLELRVVGATAGGGDFRLGFNVLQGDADQRNNRVNATDVATVRSRQNRTADEVPPTTLAPYTAFADLNGDGRINATDVSAVRARQNDTVPALVAAAGTEATPASVTEDLFGSRPILP